MGKQARIWISWIEEDGAENGKMIKRIVRGQNGDALDWGGSGLNGFFMQNGERRNCHYSAEDGYWIAE